MKITDLKNSKVGKRVFLVGNGPSLRPSQIGRLMDEDTIAMNNIAAIFLTTVWRPTYYVGVSSAFRLPEYRKQMLKGVKASQAAFVHKGFARWCHEKMIYLDAHTVETHYLDIDWRLWSDDITKGVCRWGTSMYATMQIAAYLGYKEFNLLGVDGYYSGDQQIDHHSSDYSVSEKLPTPEPEDTNRDHLIAHLMAQINCMRLGVQVYNCSGDGRLKVYERRSLREALRD